ncbi:MAG: lysine transporter LysE [Gammaproteobacteria bacterium]|nr:lysine transporter LysE [Gammaproteobacteria bacterium]
MYWGEFLTIAIAHLFAVASPGPDFAVVTRQCITAGTRAGVWTSLGLGFGILLHVTYCILGVALLISQSSFLFNAMKYLASAYLIYLGIQSVRGFLENAATSNVEHMTPEQGIRKAFILGFLTNGLNPKATLFFLALFTIVVGEDTPTMVQVLYGLYLSAATFIWFSLLSKLFGITIVRSRLLKMGKWFELVMGLALILFALQITLNII